MSLKLSTSRIEALSDVVFAIAMTLLVLKREVPDTSHHSSSMEMLRLLMAQTPAFISYDATFLIASGFWLLELTAFLAPM